MLAPAGALLALLDARLALVVVVVVVVFALSVGFVVVVIFAVVVVVVVAGIAARFAPVAAVLLLVRAVGPPRGRLAGAAARSARSSAVPVRLRHLAQSLRDSGPAVLPHTIVTSFFLSFFFFFVLTRRVRQVSDLRVDQSTFGHPTDHRLRQRCLYQSSRLRSGTECTSRTRHTRTHVHHTHTHTHSKLIVSNSTQEELIGMPYTNFGSYNTTHRPQVPALIRKYALFWPPLLASPYYRQHASYGARFFFAFSHSHSCAAARPPMTSGDVFSFSPLVRCKDGRLLRLADRSQFFYDHAGDVREGPHLLFPSPRASRLTHDMHGHAQHDTPKTGPLRYFVRDELARGHHEGERALPQVASAATTRLPPGAPPERR